MSDLKARIPIGGTPGIDTRTVPGSGTGFFEQALTQRPHDPFVLEFAVGIRRRTTTDPARLRQLGCMMGVRRSANARASVV
jgi:hypothetical protein